MPRRIIVFIAVLVLGGGFLLWHSVASGPSGMGLGCYSAPASVLDEMTGGGRLQRTDCARPHDWEIISLLRKDGAEQRCEHDADAHLGGPWRQSRVVYGLFGQPDPMDGGLFCALAETAGLDGRPVGSTASHKGGMRGDRRLAITCLTADLDDPDNLLFGACTEHHSTEVAGAGTAEGCAGVVAAYVGLTVEQLAARGDLLVRETDGDRGLCLVAEADDPAGRHDTLRASVKDLGPAPLPV
jgi:hypothetical protein